MSSGTVSARYCRGPRDVRGAQPAIKERRRGKGMSATATFLRSQPEIGCTSLLQSSKRTRDGPDLRGWQSPASACGNRSHRTDFVAWLHHLVGHPLLRHVGYDAAEGLLARLRHRHWCPQEPVSPVERVGHLEVIGAIQPPSLPHATLSQRARCPHGDDSSPSRLQQQDVRKRSGTYRFSRDPPRKNPYFQWKQTLPCTTLKKNFRVQIVRPPVFHQGGLGQVGVWFGGGLGEGGPGGNGLGGGRS